MKLDQIHTFVTVYKMGSYQKAAESLFLPQPTISHRISQLEKELGKTLLVRGRGGARLTEEGKAFLPHAQNIVAELKEGREAVENVGLGAAGKLSIGCNNSFAGHVLPHIIDSFTRQYPHISVGVYSCQSKELMLLMKNHSFQLCFTRYTSNDSGIAYRPVYSEQTKALVSPAHRFARETSVPLKEILKEPLITYPKNTGFRKKIDAVLDQHADAYQVKYETNNILLIKHFLRQNAGVFLSGQLYMLKELRDKELVQVEIEDNPFLLNHVFAAYREGELNSLDHLFVKHFKESISKITAMTVDDGV